MHLESLKQTFLILYFVQVFMIVFSELYMSQFCLYYEQRPLGAPALNNK